MKLKEVYQDNIMPIIIVYTQTIDKSTANGMEIYIRSICKKDNTNQFLEIMKKYFSFDLENAKFTEEE